MMRTRLRILAAGATLAGALSFPQVALAVNKEFSPQDEFRLEPWVSIHVGPLDLSINKAVFFVLLAAAATLLFFWLLTRHLQRRPDTKQTILELVYDFCVEQLGKANMPEAVLRLWFPYVATLFVFIWFSNMLGFIPMPIDTEHKLFGFLPQFTIYAATANLSVPLALAFVSVIGYHVEGIKAKGLFRYMVGWIPEGVTGPARVPLFIIEAISHAVRLVSLSVRLFTNMLAGHLVILMMVGMSVILETVVGLVFVPIGVVFYVLEVVLIASLQAFIFSVLTAIYLGEAVAESH